MRPLQGPMLKARILLYHKSHRCQVLFENIYEKLFYLQNLTTSLCNDTMIGMNMKTWIEKYTHDLSGVHVAITGPTGGLGVALCRHLAALNASLILLDRNAEKSAALQSELKAQFPRVSLQRVPLDLADMSSVCAACEQLKTLPIDILIHNAAVYSVPRYRCDTGLDNVFQINCASPYYLTQELLPLLRRRHGHVVMVSSIAHNYAKSDPADIDFSTRQPARLVYGNAKRRLMFSLFELFENEADVTLSVAHPGITFTNITAHYPKLIFALIKHPMKWIFMKPRTACLSLLRGVFEPTKHHTWIGPRFFNVWGLPATQKLHTASHEEITRIARETEAIYDTFKSKETQRP